MPNFAPAFTTPRAPAEMDAHHHFYHYQPSFDADQAKIDEFFSLGTDSLNTPNIDPDFFTEATLFKTCNGKALGMKAMKGDPLVDDFNTFTNDITLTQANPVNAQGNPVPYGRSAAYSPAQQLESSAIININSPEMMPVSPNKVCAPSMDASYAIEDDSTVYSQMAEYEHTLALYASPSTSTCNSRSSSISAGSSCDQSSTAEYLLYSTVDSLANDPSLICTVPHSPASISSHYSAESKTFTNLDAVQMQHQQQQHQQQQQQQQQTVVQIKQEPVDILYQPTVIEEFEQTSNGISMYLGQQQPLTSSSAAVAYPTLNPADINAQYYQYSTVNNMPSTVASVVLQPTTPTGSTSSSSRKRNAASAFASAASTSSNSNTNGIATTSGTKKPRMTKREKQKMMESDISKFETENRDLRQSIDYLERQISFCKRFLSENVAPVIQRQQAINVSFGNSPMMVTVNEM